MSSKWYVKNRERLLKYYKEYNQSGKGKEIRKMWYNSNKERLKEYKSQWYQKNKDKIDKEKRKEYNKQWYEKNSGKHRKVMPRIIYTEDEKKEIKISKAKHRAVRERKKYHSNKYFRFDKNLCSHLRKCIKENKDYRIFSKYTGYTIQELRQHLENQFDEKMSWENYGTYWSIDHIIPKSKFKFSSLQEEDFSKCWELKNIQPLEIVANIKKGNKIIQASK